MGTEILMIPEGAAPISAVAAEQILASGIPSITVTNEAETPGENVNLVYQGLTNTGLGYATVAVTNGQLIVSNLGSSGQDGVAIAMPSNLTALQVHWQALDSGNTLPVGAYIREQLVGTDEGITDGVLGTVTVTKECAVCNGTNYLVSADFAPIGAGAYTVQAYLNGVLAGQATNLNGASLAAMDAWPESADSEGGIPVCTGSFDFGTNAVAVFLGGATSAVTCDHLYITPENVTLESAPTALQIVASQVPVVTIASENESLLYQGLINTSVGSATVAVACCISNLGSSGQDGLALVVSNLSSSGQDGVSIALPANLTALDVHCQDMDPSNTLPVGEYVRSKVIGPIGAAGTVTNGVLGTVTMTKVGTSNYQVTANFAALGATNCLVQAYLNGILVGQGTTNTGTTNVASDIIVVTQIDDDGTSWDTEFDDENCYKCSTIDCVDATAMTLPGGTVVYANQVWIIPLNIPLIKPTAFQLMASQVPAITVISENESLRYQGLTNTSLGSATVAVACCISNLSSGGQDGLALVISNLGSSGQDGVSIALPTNLTALDVEYQPLESPTRCLSELMFRTRWSGRPMALATACWAG